MSLLDQIETVVGRRLPAVIAEDVRAKAGLSKREFYQRLERC
jgi:hypothetical protein